MTTTTSSQCKHFVREKRELQSGKLSRPPRGRTHAALPPVVAWGPSRPGAATGPAEGMAAFSRTEPQFLEVTATTKTNAQTPPKPPILRSFRRHRAGNW